MHAVALLSPGLRLGLQNQWIGQAITANTSIFGGFQVFLSWAHVLASEALARCTIPQGPYWHHPRRVSGRRGAYGACHGPPAASRATPDEHRPLTLDDLSWIEPTIIIILSGAQKS